jgi:hypothetical protein
MVVLTPTLDLAAACDDTTTVVATRDEGAKGDIGWGRGLAAVIRAPADSLLMRREATDVCRTHREFCKDTFRGLRLAKIVIPPTVGRAVHTDTTGGTIVWLVPGAHSDFGEVAKRGCVV